MKAFEDNEVIVFKKSKGYYLPPQYVIFWPLENKILLWDRKHSIWKAWLGLIANMDLANRSSIVRLRVPELSEQLGVRVNHLHTSLLELRELGAIQQREDGCIHLNPNFVFIGKAEQHKILVQEWQEWEAKHPQRENASRVSHKCQNTRPQGRD